MVCKILLILSEEAFTRNVERERRNYKESVTKIIGIGTKLQKEKSVQESGMLFVQK